MFLIATRIHNPEDHDFNTVNITFVGDFTKLKLIVNNFIVFMRWSFIFLYSYSYMPLNMEEA